MGSHSSNAVGSSRTGWRQHGFQHRICSGSWPKTAGPLTGVHPAGWPGGPTTLPAALPARPTRSPAAAGVGSPGRSPAGSTPGPPGRAAGPCGCGSSPSPTRLLRRPAPPGRDPPARQSRAVPLSRARAPLPVLDQPVHDDRPEQRTGRTRIPRRPPAVGAREHRWIIVARNHGERLAFILSVHSRDRRRATRRPHADRWGHLFVRARSVGSSAGSCVCYSMPIRRASPRSPGVAVLRSRPNRILARSRIVRR